MGIDELLTDLCHECVSSSVASVSFDDELFTLSRVDYVLIRIKDRYVIICNIPETDFDSMLIAYCRNTDEIIKFLHSEASGYKDIEGAEFKAEKEIEDLATKAPDRFECVCGCLDGYFDESIDEWMVPPVEQRKFIKPSEVLDTMVDGQGLRPTNPMGFVIDENDCVYIRDGSIRFGPIGGDEMYYADELGYALDCLGIKWSCQRFLLSEDNFNQLQVNATPSQFIHMFTTSKKLLNKPSTRR